LNSGIKIPGENELAVWPLKRHFSRKDSAMKILAIDLGKFKSVFCLSEGSAGGEQYGKVATDPGCLHDLLVKHQPDRLVIEAGPAAGWICDMAQGMKITIQVANTNDERWQWKKSKQKTDRKDALKLARLSALDCLPTVHVPSASVRQWRCLIEYRHHLVERRTAMKNNLRSIFERQGLRLPGGAKAWTAAGLAAWRKEARAAGAAGEQWWRYQLHVELELLGQLEQKIQELESQLEELAKANKRVALLQSAPYVGPRLSEAVVAILDDPQRFKNGRQVGCYAGLTPRRWQSGTMDRQGHISHAGNRLLRKLLVEIAWLGVRGNTWMKKVYESVCRGSDKRKKIAIVAVARRLLVKLWAMLRDGTPWKEALATAPPALAS
jgi:transposase